jgi:hypothetical protein
MNYWTACRYCGKRVRGIQGIRGHKKGCPFTHQRKYSLNGTDYLVKGSRTVLQFWDFVYSRCNPEDGAQFLWMLEQYRRKKRFDTRFSYKVQGIAKL